MTSAASSRPWAPRRRWWVLAVVLVVLAVGALWLRTATGAQPAPSTWDAGATPPPSGTVAVFQAPADSLTDIAPLQDGRVLVLTRSSLFVLGTDGVLRGTDRRDHRRIAVRDGHLLSTGPVPDGGDGLRLAQPPD